MIPPIFHYTGHKFKRLGAILPLIPKHTTFYEPFCGSGVVGINSVDSGLSESVILNDLDANVIELLFYMLSTPRFEDEAKQIDITYEPTKSGYESLKADYNSIATSVQHSTLRYAMLYCLICRSFNNQMRFNKKGEFNLPFGARNRFNLTAWEMARKVYESKSIGFMRSDFREVTATATPDDFVFVDPPYINSVATYNSGWKEDIDAQLYVWLDGLTSRGIKWMLTSTLHNRGKVNKNLQQYIESRELDIRPLKGTYANSSYHKSSEKTVELAVMNYFENGESNEQYFEKESSEVA